MLSICSLLMAEKRSLAAYEDYFHLDELLDVVGESTGLM
jgi:hypothetical protein